MKTKILKDLTGVLFLLIVLLTFISAPKLFAFGTVELKAGGQMLKWLPDQPVNSEIETVGYMGGSIDARLTIAEILRLYRFKYEFSNGIKAPTFQARDELIKSNLGKTGYVLFNLLGEIFPPTLPNNLGLVLRADYQDYRSTVKFRDRVVYYPYNIADLGHYTPYGRGDNAAFYTRFNDILTGISFGSAPDEEKYGRFFLGFGRSMYQKPYSFHISDDMSIDDAIFDTRFEGNFLALGMVGDFIMINGAMLKMIINYHYGSGDMVLVKDKISISDIAMDNDSRILYSAMDFSAAYAMSFTDDLKFSLEGSFAIRSFDLKTPNVTVEEAYNLNQDYFFGIRAALTYIFRF